MTSSPSTALAPPPGPPDASRTRLRPDIQGLRAVAVIGVVAYHAGLPVPGGFSGVDVFFVISGFVIVAAIARRIRAGTFRLRDFSKARIRRLLPALALMLVVVMAATALLGTIGSMGATARTGAAASLINANTYLMLGETSGYFDSLAVLNPLLHTWSLSVEEQFYLVVPALLVLGWIATGRRRLPGMVIMAAILVASFVTMLVLATRSHDITSLSARIDFYSPMTRAWEFAAGGLLALVAWRPPRSLALATGVVGAILVIVGYGVLREAVVYPSMITLLPVVGAALVIASGTHHPDTPVARALAWRPAVAIGDVSYSWYLWHWPFIVFTGIATLASRGWIVVAAIASLPVAWASTRFLENPIRFRRNAPTRATVVLALVCVIAPLITAGGLLLWQGRLKSDATLNPFALHQENLHGCDGPVSLAHKPADCTWHVAHPRGHAVLIGDSLAGQYTEGFTAAMNGAGLDATVATLSGCPFLDWGTHEQEARDLGIWTDPDCARFVHRTMDDLLRDPPTALVLTSSAQRFLPGDATGATPQRAAARTALIEKARAEMVQRLQDAGIHVALLGPLAKFPAWGGFNEGPFKQASALSVLTHDPRITALAPSFTAAQLDAEIAAATAAEKAGVETAGAVFVDLRPIVCGDAGCSTRGDNGWRYRDFEHLSVATSHRVQPVFEQLARTLAP
mgnify:CR=1 FL=1